MFNVEVKNFLRKILSLRISEALLLLLYNLPFFKGRIRNLRFGYKLIDNYKFPFYLRPNISDYKNYKQIFENKEYALLDDIDDVKFIIDCGAYIGLSSIWFLNRFQNAFVISVESNLGNFLLSRRNLKPYKKRVALIYSAIWSHRAGLIVSRGEYMDHLDWASQVRECKEHEQPDIYSIGMASLIENSGYDRVDILKIDIERAEIKLFSSSNNLWLNKIRNIAIELHDQECADAFFNALSGYNFDSFAQGELTFCKNLTKKS